MNQWKNLLAVKGEFPKATCILEFLNYRKEISREGDFEREITNKLFKNILTVWGEVKKCDMFDVNLFTVREDFVIGISETRLLSYSLFGRKEMSENEWNVKNI